MAVLELGLQHQHPLLLAPPHPTEEAHAQQRLVRSTALQHHGLDAQHFQIADLDPVEHYPPATGHAAGSVDLQRPAADPVVDAQAPGVGVVERHRRGPGVDQKLHRLAIDRARRPVVTANALGDAQALFHRFGETTAVLATHGIGALDTIDAQHGALLVDTDHLHAIRAGVTDANQLALTIDVDHRRAG